MAEFEVVLMATTASSDASRSAATSPRPTEISEDENLGHMTGEEDGEEEEEEEKEEETLENPSRDIKGDLERIFNKKSFKFTGNFYASRRYPNAPNPGLNVKGFGLVGLPLVASVAKPLISKCQQAAFGKGERTIVDKNVRDTWEIDASKVTFQNQAWSKWVNSTVLPAVCEQLGVNIDASKPRAELYKLLVYEKGSHFLPHQDTAKSAGMFGTIVILLPSPFTGGALDLSHSGKHMVIDASTESSTSTHVAAWYTDVYHAVKPVHSGYRLALSYNLIHSTAPSLKPAINTSALTQQLKHTLLSWRYWDHPMKLVYLMDHMYSAQELRTVSLKGKDAHLVSNLRGVAKELGFRLCLVNLELHQSGQAEDHGQFDHYDPYEEYDSDDEDAVEYHRQAQQGLTICEVEDQTWSIDDAIDLDGQPVELNEDLEWSDEDEFFPHGLDATSPDEEEYEGYMGNYGGNLDLWYRRTALLIWPEQHDLDIIVEDVADYAEENLNQSDSEKATVKEKRMAETLITWCESHDDIEGVLEALRTAAVRWKDADLWVRACTAAQVDSDIDILGCAEIIKDVEVFGFGALTEFLESAIDNNKTDEPRFRLLHELKKLADRTSDRVLLQWTKEQTESVLCSIRTTSIRNIRHYVGATKRRGYRYLQEIILPQLISLKPPSAFWQAFVIALREAKDKLPPDANELDKVIESLVIQQISGSDPFPVQSTLQNQPADRTADLVSWISTVKEGAVLGDHAIKSYFERMQQSWDKMPAPERLWMAQNFLPGAIKHLCDWASSCVPPRLPGDVTLEPFWILSLICYLEHVQGHHAQLVTTLRWCGELARLKDRLTPIIRKLATHSSSSLQKLVYQAHQLSSQPEADECLATSLKLLIHVSTLELAANAPIGRIMGYDNGTSKPPPDYTLSINLIHTVLRCNFMQPIEQAKEKELPEPELDETVDFSKHSGLSGVTKWMQQAFEETPDAEMLQAEFWNLYKKASIAHGIDGTLIATKLLKLVTTTFPQAYLKVVPGTNNEPSKYMIMGLGGRRKVTKNQTNDPPAQLIEEPQPFVKAFSIVLKRVLDFSMTVQYLNACLLPLIRACIAELRSLNMTWPSQPLANFACSVIYNMVKQVGPKPLVPLTNTELMGLGCGCTHCLDLRRFAGSNAPVLAVRAAEKVRRHVEGQLGMKAREWGFTSVTIRTGSPHTLQITKPAIFGAHKTWIEGKQRALVAMATLGPVSTQAAILGAKWPEVCTILQINQPAYAESNALPVIREITLSQHGYATAGRALPGPSVPRVNNVAAPAQAATTKRSFQQAFQEARASQAAGPVTKRNKPVEIIELSD